MACAVWIRRQKQSSTMDASEAMRSFHTAASAGDVDALTRIYESEVGGAWLLTARHVPTELDPSDCTALFYACLTNKLDAIKYLLSIGDSNQLEARVHNFETLPKAAPNACCIE
jgi:hypothetical protein